MGRVNLPHVDVISQSVVAEFKGRCYDAEFVSHRRWLATTRLRGTLFGAYGDSFEAAIETCHKAVEMYDDCDPPAGFTPGLGVLKCPEGWCEREPDQHPLRELREAREPFKAVRRE